MRIGIVTGEYPPMQGGVGAYTAILARELAAQGHAVSVLTTPPAVDARSDSISVFAAVRDWGPGAALTIRRWARDIEAEIINLQYQTAAYQMSPVIHFLPELLRPLPVVTTFHDLRFPYLFPKAGPLRPWIVRKLARGSRGAIVTNHEDAADLADLSLIRLIPIGSNILSGAPAAREVFRRRTGTTSDETLITYFGLVNRSKGLDVLLRACRSLLDRGVQARLALVGAVAGDSDPSNHAYSHEIEALIGDLDMEDAVFRTGYLPEQDVAGFLAAADVVALPFADGASYRRGSLMAAVRLGCAIVTTQPRVAVPSFQDGITMRLVPPGDPGALTDALFTLIKDTPLQQRLRAGSARLAQSFDWAQIAQDTAAFFDTVTGRQK
ncbi:MAG: glycosyltransferase family 4 protein [Anaerolineae bacterium]|nr:glycosyltransferase family 4 protein [Anaerolineae bacterium]NUQ02380.1 glycosyltransferase family 4 protein [Anaerolineae bacterium]